MSAKRFTVYLRSPEGVVADGNGFVAGDDSGIQLNQNADNPIAFGGVNDSGSYSAHRMAAEALGGHSVFIPMGNVAMYIWYGTAVTK